MQGRILKMGLVWEEAPPPEVCCFHFTKKFLVPIPGLAIPSHSPCNNYPSHTSSNVNSKLKYHCTAVTVSQVGKTCGGMLSGFPNGRGCIPEGRGSQGWSGGRELTWVLPSNSLSIFIVMQSCFSLARFLTIDEE